MKRDVDGVLAHYDRTREEDRLSGLGELELVRTQEVLRRHLGPPAQRVLDVGGGTGVHARLCSRTATVSTSRTSLRATSIML